MTQMHDVDDLAFDLFDRLHKSLRVSGLTTTTLGAALGVHRNTISNYLTGRTAMDRRTLIAWAFATGVPLEWLENGQSPTSPTSGPGASASAKEVLPRLDSNQQPSGSPFSLVSALGDAA